MLAKLRSCGSSADMAFRRCRAPLRRPSLRAQEARPEEIARARLTMQSLVHSGDPFSDRTTAISHERRVHRGAPSWTVEGILIDEGTIAASESGSSRGSMTNIPAERIAAIEARKEELQAAMSAADLAPDAFVKLSKDYAEILPGRRGGAGAAAAARGDGGGRRDARRCLARDSRDGRGGDGGAAGAAARGRAGAGAEAAAARRRRRALGDARNPRRHGRRRGGLVRAAICCACTSATPRRRAGSSS